MFRMWIVICNFWHPGTLTLRAERQSARMPKITNDGLTRSDTGCFTAVPYENSGRQRVKWNGAAIRTLVLSNSDPASDTADGVFSGDATQRTSGDFVSATRRTTPTPSRSGDEVVMHGARGGGELGQAESAEPGWSVNCSSVSQRR